MSGFQLPRTSYKLVFDAPDYAGLEIKVRGITLDELCELDEADEAVSVARGARPVWEAIRARNALFVDKITSWNLEDNGNTVPCTVEELGRIEASFVKRMIDTWRDAAAGVVPAPLGGGSTSGTTSPEMEATLMNIPAESLAS
jgi:hypothetical protein